jgi:hypothetical protein
MADELSDLVEDPDWEHVPDELRRLDGKPVKLLTDDGVESGVLIVRPGDFGDAARKRDDDDAA